MPSGTLPPGSATCPSRRVVSVSHTPLTLPIPHCTACNKLCTDLYTEHAAWRLCRAALHIAAAHCTLVPRREPRPCVQELCFATHAACPCHIPPAV
eukprot:4130425-Pleurochrysis_carterae.AAC.2